MPNKMKALAEYEPLRPIMQAYGASCTPQEFYWAVNDAFHTVEAKTYDKIHAGMFAGSDPMWSRLLKCVPGTGWEVLDVGAGTGLVGEHLVRLAPGKVKRLTMLDPNDAMLERARERSKGWPMFDLTFLKGDISAVKGRFDLITVSSVFHHVPEIEDFSACINRLLKQGGVLIQMQDPKADSQLDPVLSGRRATAQRSRTPSLYRRVRSLGGDMLRSIGVKQSGDPVAKPVNAILMEKGVICRPLSMATIWAVTDFHVPGQPEGMGKGFTIRQLTEWLDLKLLDTFTYEFQGKAWDELSLDEQAKEKAWFAAKDQHGALFGSAWLKAT